MSIDGAGRRLANALQAQALATTRVEPVTIERLTARAALQPRLRDKVAIMSQAIEVAYKVGDDEWAKGVEWALALLGQAHQEP
jgi:hypothetical protein